MEPRILGETGEVIAILKPAGLITHRDGRTDEPSLAEWLAEERPDQRGVGEAWVSPQGERIEVNGIVHRLDRATSGVLLAAKSDEMFRYLRGEFQARRVVKTYRAIVHGCMDAEEGRIVAEIVRTSEPPRRWEARPCDEDDRRAAVTEWRSLRELQDGESGAVASELTVRPLTGRTHQIRVHLASIEHPLVGDSLYGAPAQPSFGFTRPALHAERISLVMPGGPVVFICPPPHDFPPERHGRTVSWQR